MVAKPEIVTPGVLTHIDPQSKLGHGLALSDNGVIAVASGFLSQEEGIWHVVNNNSTVNSLEVGDEIIGEVHGLQPKVAIIRILSVQKEGSEEKSLPAEQMFADITVTELCDRFMPSAGDAMRKRDIIRAMILTTEPIARATTKSHKSLGVLHAICTTCGYTLQASDKTVDFNVECPRCDYRGYRVLSSDFNNVNGLDIVKINREGTRWSAEAENMLGHDGARPYLSPVADHRRGWIHSAPKSGINSRSNRGQNRPRREMHDAKCTLCGDNTKVPFEPTMGKPIRCRDCLDKVKQGVADKEMLAKERNLLIKQKKEHEKNAPLRLFVGRLPRDALEEDLRNLFGKHGNVVDFHMPVDRETGNPRGFAFVTMSPKSSGEVAIEKLNGSEFGGRKIVVEASQKDERKRNSRRR